MVGGEGLPVQYLYGEDAATTQRDEEEMTALLIIYWRVDPSMNLHDLQWFLCCASFAFALDMGARSHR
jgi:hypothetical protein